jgi:hypothetical protein
MSAVGRPIVHGFWSYAREQKKASKLLHEALAAGLRESLGRNPEVHIFLDVNAECGINWHQELVRSIARSVLFFWLQSPSCLNSTLCRFELEMFRGQAARIARRFSTSAPIDPERLFQHWLVAIRWVDMHPGLWAMQGDDPATLEVVNLWRQTQVPDDFRMDRAGVSDEALRHHGKVMGKKVCDKLLDSLTLLGGHTSQARAALLGELLDFVALEDPAFEALWLARLPSNTTSAPSGTVLGQRRLADAVNGGATRLTHEGTNFFLVPLQVPGRLGFWAGAEPLGGALARRISACLSAGRPGPNGHLRWPAQALGAITGLLQPYRLQLPDRAEAAALLELEKLGFAGCAQLGWTAPVGNFWVRADNGFEPAVPRDGDLPLLLTTPLD